MNTEKATANDSGPVGSASHMLLAGAALRGRSLLIESEVSSPSVGYPIAPKAKALDTTERIAPEADDLADLRVRRLEAVRRAYWTDDARCHSEFRSLSTALKGLRQCEPSTEQLRKLFELLPAEIIGDGIKLGFHHPSVGAGILDFVRKEARLISAVVFSC